MSISRDIGEAKVAEPWVVILCDCQIWCIAASTFLTHACTLLWWSSAVWRVKGKLGIWIKFDLSGGNSFKVLLKLPWIAIYCTLWYPVHPVWQNCTMACDEVKRRRKKSRQTGGSCLPALKLQRGTELFTYVNNETTYNYYHSVRNTVQMYRLGRGQSRYLKYWLTHGQVTLYPVFSFFLCFKFSLCFPCFCFSSSLSWFEEYESKFSSRLLWELLGITYCVSLDCFDV